jgi:hypothetical protein
LLLGWVDMLASGMTAAAVTAIARQEAAITTVH